MRGIGRVYGFCLVRLVYLLTLFYLLASTLFGARSVYHAGTQGNRGQFLGFQRLFPLLAHYSGTKGVEASIPFPLGYGGDP